MKKRKIIGLVIIGIIFLISTVHIVNKIKEKIEEKRIEKEIATPTEIENINLYEKNQILKLLKEEYPEEEFEIICYLSDINKESSKWSPSQRKVGKKVMVRPNGQIGEEFLVKYYDNDEEKFFSTPIEPIIESYYKDEETVETRKINKILEEYVQPVLDKNLEGKERFKDYNVSYAPSASINLEWLKSIESINDYFYTEPDDEYGRYRKVINICIYINEDELNEEELYFYYDSFQKIANELFIKIDYEKSSIEEYTVFINLFKLGDEEFNNIKSLGSQTLNILHEKWTNNIDFHWYRKRVNIENGEVIDKDETSFDGFKK